ncbi:MAG: substrate-binding domain-containing protein, partial [Lachnospiraceae bacterium]|nr:substrate-binding domain-containing protein [Lachnospiraceae bacterium]
MSKKYSDGKDYKVIAFVHACFSTEDQRELVKMITKKSAEHNCKVVFFSTLTNFYMDQLDYGELRIFDTISVEKFDAIVFMAETFKTEEGQHKFVQRATAAGVPVIAVDHYVEGCINISFDYKEAFREIVKHMVEYHGYRTINFMGGQPNNSFSEERLQVLKEVLAENNLPFDNKQVYHGYFWEVPTVEAMEKMLADSPTLPEAIVCANDTMALTVCDFLKKHGFRVPEDVAVSGFDGLEAGRYHQPQLLTSVYDVNAFADALFTLVNGEECVVGERELKVSAYNQIQIGGSCGCKGINAIDAASKIIQIKSDMNEQMEYQINLGRVVANYGDGEGMEIIREVIPDQLKFMHYHDFWLCSEERLLIADYPNYSAKKQTSNCGIFNVIHYDNHGESVKINYAEN